MFAVATSVHSNEVDTVDIVSRAGLEESRCITSVKHKSGGTGKAVGTSVAEPTFGSPHMDDKTLNLWRQIEGARRVGKRQVMRSRPAVPAVPVRD